MTMKRKYSIQWLMAIAVATTFALTACSSDDDDNNQAPDRQETTTYDDLDYFQRTIVNVDSLGNFISRQYGTPLYDNDTTHLYIGVESIAEAEKMFRSWLAPDIEAVPTPTGDITVSLTDREGKSQGTVYFRPGTGGTMAEITASTDTRLLHFSQITFLVNSAWPFNSPTSRWHVGDIVRDVHLSRTVYGKSIETNFKSGDIPRNWVCIREAGNGVNPMFCAITSKTYTIPAGPVNESYFIEQYYGPGLGTANVIKDLLNSDWDFFVACFEESGGGTLDNSGFWIYDHHWSWFSYYYEVYYYQSGYHYGENEHSTAQKRILLKIDWVSDEHMHDGGSY